MQKPHPTRFFAVLIFLSIAVSYFTLGFPFPPPVLGEQTDKTWTFMVYLDGDNKLETLTVDIFLMLASVGSSSEVNIIVQMDRADGYDSRYGDWTDCKRFYVTQGSTPVSANTTKNLGEVNMGDADTLKNFINWGVYEHPADNFCLVLFDHGSGCVKFSGSSESCTPLGVCFDETSGDVLTISELSQAFIGIGEKIDVVFFDTCDVGMLEAAYQIEGYVDIMVGSEEVALAVGPYDNYLSSLVGNPSISPRNFASAIVNTYVDWAPSSSTMSAINLTEISRLVAETDNFAQKLSEKENLYVDVISTVLDETESYLGPYQDYSGYYIDLYGFAQLIYQYAFDGEICAAADAVMDHVSDAIIVRSGNNRPNSHGLSIFFPGTKEKYNKFRDSYKSTAFATHAQWNELVEQYLLVSPPNAYVGKPVYPVKIRESEIPIGTDGTYRISLEKNRVYHAYCYGGWIDYGSDPETDYDIYVYDPQDTLVSYHTEAAGLPEHLGTTAEQSFFIPEFTGDYRFVIKNDARESEGAEEATLMVIERVECNQWLKLHMQGKDENDKPVQKTTWAFEFYTTSKHVEVYLEVPDTLDMYEARLYPVANPPKGIGTLLNNVPLAWEPGLYGDVYQGYGGYNLDSMGFRHPDAVASCEYSGQDMLVNYTHSDDGGILYHLVLIAETGSGEVNFNVKTDFSPSALNPTQTEFIPKPVLPTKIEESQVLVGGNWTFVYSLYENRSYHVYCYGDWIDHEKETAKTDYDIYVYDPYGELVSSHTEAAGMAEHLGTTVDQPFFIPKHTGNYSFVIKNDLRESNDEKEATLMVIEHVECNEWHQCYLRGKVDDKPVEETSWAYEFCTNSDQIEVWVDVPPGLDMYEARLYLMANPPKNVGTTLNGVPLAWEPGLYGSLESSHVYGGFNLDDGGYRNHDFTASCEFLGQDMLINYTSSYGSDLILYHLVLIAEHGEGNVKFMIKTDFDSPEISVKDPVELAYPSNETTIIAEVLDENRLKNVWLNYTNNNWSTSASIDMIEDRNCTYTGSIPRQLAGTIVKYKVLAIDTAENQAEIQYNYTVKNPTQIELSLSKYICQVDEPVVVNGLISHGGAVVKVDHACNGELDYTSTVRASSNGAFSGEFIPNKSGFWTISASWPGNQTCLGAFSNCEELAVSKIVASLTCNVTEGVVTIGKNVTVAGSINPSLNHASIRLVFTRQNGSTIETSVYTETNGAFKADFTPDSLGAWEVTAEFDGDSAQFAASESYPTTFLVRQAPGLGYDFYIYIVIAAAAGAAALIIILRMYRLRAVE
jgi:hypothetical protein